MNTEARKNVLYLIHRIDARQFDDEEIHNTAANGHRPVVDE